MDRYEVSATFLAVMFVGLLSTVLLAATLLGTSLAALQDTGTRLVQHLSMLMQLFHTTACGPGGPFRHLASCHAGELPELVWRSFSGVAP